MIGTYECKYNLYNFESKLRETPRNDVFTTTHERQYFSTFDNDNDAYANGNCAQEDGSGWWFNRCSAANLNAPYYTYVIIKKILQKNIFRRKHLHKMKENDNYDHGILWATWKDRFTAFQKTEIWIRPYDIEARDRLNFPSKFLVQVFSDYVTKIPDEVIPFDESTDFSNYNKHLKKIRKRLDRKRNQATECERIYTCIDKTCTT